AWLCTFSPTAVTFCFLSLWRVAASLPVALPWTPPLRTSDLCNLERFFKEIFHFLFKGPYHLLKVIFSDEFCFFCIVFFDDEKVIFIFGYKLIGIKLLTAMCWLHLYQDYTIDLITFNTCDNSSRRYMAYYPMLLDEEPGTQKITSLSEDDSNERQNYNPMLPDNSQKEDCSLK
ncbi:hypothetical protein STEG23_007232, partial [Scotinomys teguina]